MLIAPGRVCLAYVRGDRKTYSNPATFCLATATLSVVVLRLLPEPAAAPPSQDVPSLAQLRRAAGLEAAQTIAEHSALLNLALMPLFGALLLLFFRRARINLAEATTFALFVYGELFLIEAAMFPVIRWQPWSGNVMGLMFFAYPCWAAAEFMPVRKWSAVWRTLAAHACFYAAVGVLTLAVLAFYARFAVPLTPTLPAAVEADHSGSSSSPS